jgi:WD40 repeat protein
MTPDSLHGMEIRDAVRWLQQGFTFKDRKPTELHEQYIRASEEWEAGEGKRLTDLNEEKERQRLEAERQSRIALARELVAFSTLSLEDDPERSILLAMHAVDATHSVDGAVIPEAEDVLHRAILRSPILWTMHGHSDNVWGVALSGDGRLAVSASRDDTLKVWDVDNGRELRTLRGHSAPVLHVALSRDGRFAVSASFDSVKVWDTESGRELRTLKDHTSRVEGGR